MAFQGHGYRLGSVKDTVCEEDFDPIFFATEVPTDNPSCEGDIFEPVRRPVMPTLEDICISTLERHIDMLEDIGATPYYLIESVLRKCTVAQLSRIENHSEGLSEQTDELWYIHATNEYKLLRDSFPVYDSSGEWHSIYQTKKREEQEKIERMAAKLRQSYSQHDRSRQGRSVIVDPNLKHPGRRSATTALGFSSSAPVAKKRTLFEKARVEARKITQMYNSAPYPPRSRPTGSSNTGNYPRRTLPINPASVPSRPPTLHPSTSSAANRSRTGRHLLAPTSVFASQETVRLGSSRPTPPTTQTIKEVNRHGLSSRSNKEVIEESFPALRRPKARYSYNNHPVVYATPSKSIFIQRKDSDLSPVDTGPHPPAPNLR